MCDTWETGLKPLPDSCAQEARQWPAYLEGTPMAKKPNRELMGIHKADQENARLQAERDAAPDGMTASERAMARSTGQIEPATTHGGARPGAGRKPRHGRKATKAVNVILPKQVVQQMDRKADQAEISRAELARLIILDAMADQARLADLLGEH